MNTPQWPKETLDVYRKIQAHLRVLVTLDGEIRDEFMGLKNAFPKPIPEDVETVKLTDDDLIQIVCQHALTAPIWDGVMNKKDFSDNSEFAEKVDNFVKLIFKRQRA